MIRKATRSPESLTPREQQIGILTVMSAWFLMNAGFSFSSRLCLYILLMS
ncbi:MAG: hypothetical protein R3C44_03325 [Chloroflexota bacterium]